MLFKIPTWPPPGYGSLFTTQHAHSCKVGRRVTHRHDDVTNELKSCFTKVLSNTKVWNEPSIFPISPSATTNPNASDGPVCNSLHHRGLWGHGVKTIIEVRVADLDSKSQISKKADNTICQHERTKRDKYLSACLEQHHSFVAFVVSTDGLIGFKGKNLLKQIAKWLAEKWSLPYSVISGVIWARMSLAILRASHQCTIRGPQIPASKISRQPLWEDGAGLDKFD